MKLKDERSVMHTRVENRAVYYAVKRVMDTVIALFLLLLFLPLLLLIALAILIYSPGPIFFVQERVGARRQSRGRNVRWKKVTFPCYKFRTMHTKSDSSVHRAYVSALIAGDKEKMTVLQGGLSEIRKLVHDSRITRPGKFLRKTSLDELPQLLNVVRGEMSLVGPRPAIPYEVEMYKPWHRKRLEAQPGITGLQQIVARSTADFDEQVQLDIDYIQHQSLCLDFKILLKTPFVILSTRGAE
jgi:lipopolysaccharide/colanic/teichoic acid biosynthesis glycosyltransferase